MTPAGKFKIDILWIKKLSWNVQCYFMHHGRAMI